MLGCWERGWRAMGAGGQGGPGEARRSRGRVTEMLRRINSEAGADLRGQSQEVEEERLEEAVSRRSSGADSGVGNMEDMGDILDPDRSRRGESAWAWSASQCGEESVLLVLYENIRLQPFNDFRLLKMQLCRTLVMQSFRWYIGTGQQKSQPRG